MFYFVTIQLLVYFYNNKNNNYNDSTAITMWVISKNELYFEDDVKASGCVSKAITEISL